MSSQIRMKIEEFLTSIGIEVKEDLTEQLDSISFVTIIVEIEQGFGIEVPDDRLDIIGLSTVTALENMVIELLEQSNPIMKGGDNNEKVGQTSFP